MWGRTSTCSRVRFQRMRSGSSSQARRFAAASGPFRAALPAWSPSPEFSVIPNPALEATDATLNFIAGRPPGSEVVFTFIVKNELVEAEERAFSAAAADESATLGEPWLTCFDPAELEEHLVELGFNAIERLTPQLAVS